MGLFDAIGGALGISGDSAMLGGLGLFNGIMGMSSQADTNAQSMNMFYGNQDFQREMRDTQYQSAVKDLSAAGLNPMLAGKVGGNMASGGSSIPSLTAPYGAGIQSALTSATVAKTKADAHAAEATAENQQANADVTRELGSIKALAEIENLRSSAIKSGSETQVNAKTLEVMTGTIHKLAMDANLSEAETSKVWQEAANAIATGHEINARTGNLKMDTVLKEASAKLYDTQRELNTQNINFNVLDIPRRQAESGFWSSRYGQEMAPYVNSASKIGVSDIPKGEVLRGYKSK